MIKFNIPPFVGTETKYIQEAMRMSGFQIEDIENQS